MNELPQGILEIIPGYISLVLGAWQDSDPPTTLSGPFRFPFGVLAYSSLQGPQLSIISIHPSLPSCLVSLPRLSGV